MNKVWMCSGSTYTQVGSGYKVSESLPVGIYSISLTMTGYHLDKYADKFVFPYKMYGLQEDFIDHVTEKGMLESISKRTSFYKDGIVYQKPHIILEFSERHDESIYFDSDEEMEGWFESFRQEFGKPFIYIE